MRRSIATCLPAALIAGLCALASCANPDPVLYTLAAQPGPPAEMERQAPVRSIELRRVNLAGYLDRPGIVRAATAYRLNVTQDSRWAAPIGPMLDQVIAEDLVIRLPGVAVFTEAGGIATRPDRVLKIDIQRLDVDPSGDVVVQAQAAVMDPTNKVPTSLRSFRTVQRPASQTIEDQVAAMSQAVGALSSDLAQTVR